MKALKWVGVVFALMMALGVILVLLETDEQTAAREAEYKQVEVATAQVKAEKLQAEAETAKKAVKTRSGIPNLGGKSEPELVTECQVDIQDKLSNPRSMDIINSNLKYKKELNHELWFQFYAKNQFDAESKHTGMCEFDDDGNLLSSKFE